MEKLSWKEKIFNKDVLIISLVTLGLSIHFYYFNNLLFSRPENPNWIDVINSIILLIALTAFSGLIFMGFFSFITRDAESVEKWALKNLTKVCYFIAILIVSSFVFRYLSTEQFLTSFWALVVFWYWYKKYERDKEIEMLWRIQTWIVKISNLTDDIKQIAILYSSYKKWYLSQDVWDIIEIQIDDQISRFLESNLKFDVKGNNLTQQIKNWTEIISQSFWEFYIYWLILEKHWFMTYLSDKIQDYLESIEKKKQWTLLNEDEKKKMDNLIDLFSKIAKQLNPKTN